MDYPPLIEVITLLLLTVPIYAETDATVNIRQENIYNEQLVPSSKSIVKLNGITNVTLNKPNGFRTQSGLKVKEDSDLEIDNDQFRNYYTLTVNDGTGDGTYKYETSVKCTETVPTNTYVESEWNTPTGYTSGTRAHANRTNTFDNWDVNSNSTAHTIYYTLPYHDTTITAYWSGHFNHWQDHQHYLTVNKGTGSGWYDNDATATATSDTKPADYTETSWKGQTANASGNIRYKVKHVYTYDNGATMNVIMDAPKEVTMGYTETQTNVNRQQYRYTTVTGTFSGASGPDTISGTTLNFWDNSNWSQWFAVTLYYKAPDGTTASFYESLHFYSIEHYSNGSSHDTWDWQYDVPYTRSISGYDWVNI